MPLTTLIKAYDNDNDNIFSRNYKYLPTSYKKVLAMIGQHFQRDKRMMNFETLFNLMESRKIEKEEVHMILLKLKDMNIIELRFTVNVNNSSRFLKTWNINLLGDADDIIKACLTDIQEDVFN